MFVRLIKNEEELLKNLRLAGPPLSPRHTPIFSLRSASAQNSTSVLSWGIHLSVFFFPFTDDFPNFLNLSSHSTCQRSLLKSYLSVSQSNHQCFQYFVLFSFRELNLFAYFFTGRLPLDRILTTAWDTCFTPPFSVVPHPCTVIPNPVPGCSEGESGRQIGEILELNCKSSSTFTRATS